MYKSVSFPDYLLSINLFFLRGKIVSEGCHVCFKHTFSLVRWMSVKAGKRAPRPLQAEGLSGGLGHSPVLGVAHYRCF